VAQNFKISIKRTIDNLYLRLKGDFDGSSAFELFNTLKDNLNCTKFILVDTHKLKAVHPFGRRSFIISSQQLSISEFASGLSAPVRCTWRRPIY